MSRHVKKNQPRRPGTAAEDLRERVEQLEVEREVLLELLSQQQRVAQAGLVTAGLAHDVNNHVQIISGTAYLAERNADPSSWQHALERIQKQCCALAETTHTFLGFVRRKDEIGVGDFTLSHVIRETQRLVRPLAHQNRIEVLVDIESDATVTGAARLAIQAVVNLVTNAIRACPRRGGQVKINGVATQNGGRIEVADNGSGIPEEVRRTLFRPFASERTKRDGNGLGLFIVRQTIRRLGGSIRVRSTEHGSTFRIDLPSAP